MVRNLQFEVSVLLTYSETPPTIKNGSQLFLILSLDEVSRTAQFSWKFKIGFLFSAWVF